MNATQMSERFQLLRRLHRMRAHHRTGAAHEAEGICDACFLLDVIDTMRARNWDPATGTTLVQHPPQVSLEGQSVEDLLDRASQMLSKTNNPELMGAGVVTDQALRLVRLWAAMAV